MLVPYPNVGLIIGDASAANTQRNGPVAFDQLLAEDHTAKR
jgi:hypothetical protein